MQQTKYPRESQVEMTELVLPQHTNAIGTVFGGVVMSWVDIAAAAAALRHCQKQVVTASVDAMNFLAPIKLGWIVTIRASINYVGHASCEVGVKVLAANPLSGESFHTLSAYLTLVAIGSNGRPTSQIAAIEPENDDDRRRFEAAKIRRESRLALKLALKEQHP